MAETPTRSRVLFVDLLRFVAALQMLQGHTIAALLAPEYRHGQAYALWTVARGLTSVAFLFAAGLSFQLATELEPAAEAGAARRRRRALWLIALGYVLHLPVAALGADPAERVRALHEFLAVDVLQCIGVSILLLELGRARVSGAARRGVVALLAGALCLALTPLAAALPAGGALRPLLAYLTPHGGSIFPLLPWAAHVCLGVACAALIRLPGRLAASIRLLLAAGFGFGAAALTQRLASQAGGLVVAEHLRRLAYVLLGSSALAVLASHIDWAGRFPRLAQRLARQTLFLYVFHILLVYGHGVGLASSLGSRLGPAGAVAMALAVIACSCGLALTYDRLARARRTG